MIRRETLPNGLRLVTEAMPDVRSVSMGVWLTRGSRNEPADLNGISHFVEHLLFKGTESRSGRQIALEVDSVGGNLDAFTSKESTCFHAKVSGDNVGVAVDLLSDLVLHPRFEAAELERERQVIVEEIRMVEDTPEELVHDLFASHVYPRHALGRSIQGTERTVGSIGRSRLLRFFRSSYRPENLLVVAAGHLRHDRIARLVRDRFAKLERSRVRHSRGAPPRPRGGVVRREKRALEQCHLLLGVPTFPENHEARHRVFVLNALLGGTMSSRLFQKVREERGLAYTVYSTVNAFFDAGQLVVYAATSPERGRETLDVILREIADLREHGPSEAEIEVAKRHIEGSLPLALESTGSRMSNLARHEIYFGRQLGIDEVMRGIRAVTRRGIHALCRSIFGTDRTGLAVVGPAGGMRVAPGALRT